MVALPDLLSIPFFCSFRTITLLDYSTTKFPHVMTNQIWRRTQKDTSK